MSERKESSVVRGKQIKMKLATKNLVMLRPDSNVQESNYN